MLLAYDFLRMRSVYQWDREENLQDIKVERNFNAAGMAMPMVEIGPLEIRYIESIV